MRKSFPVCAAVLAALIQPALADHGKVGAWHLDTQTKLADPHGVMLHFNAYEAAGIKAAYNKKSKADYCMKPEDVSADAIRIWLPGCTVGPTTVSGQSLNATFRCEGKLAGSGTMTVTYDSPEHYAGTSVFTPTSGMGLESHGTYDGKWTGEACPTP